MKGTILGAVITAIGAILAALITGVFVPYVRSRSFRSSHDIPDILGKWKNQWFVGHEDKLFSEDTFEIEKWDRNSQFRGTGNEPKAGPYSISGEISSNRLVIGTYKDTDFPNMAYIGNFIVRLSVDGKSMEGFWQGLTEDNQIQEGKLTCKKQV
jgi:hypothetical protein